MFKRIAIFDFDGTVVDTPLPETGRKLYEQVTGREWPHKGWWSKPDSLDMDIFPMPVIEAAVAAFHKEKATPGTLTVMMTGRIKKLSKHVEAILHAKGLVFDEYVYNTGAMGNVTLDYKLAMLDTYRKKYPFLESFALWEDRVEHVDAFKEWGAKQERLLFEITVIESDHHQ